MRSSLAALACLLLFAVPALGQDATLVDSDHYTVEFENDQVRVLRIKYGPHEKSVMHEHPGAVAVFLTAGQIRMWSKDGTSQDMTIASGQVSWNDAVSHLPENRGDAPFEVILIELKSSSEEGCM